MDGLIEAIEEWVRGILTEMILKNMTTMYTDVNEKTGLIASEVAKTPQGWNGSIYSMIRGLSDSVMLPIATMVITFVLCVELISMIMEKNNMQDFDTWLFFKYFLKMSIAVYVVSHTFDIVMAIFDVGQHIVTSASSVITGSTAVDISDMMTDMETKLEAMEMGEMIILTFETFLVSFCLKILSIIITVILYIRMVEIYLYISVSPVTFSTFGNKEIGQIGSNYVKGLIALAFQGFFIMVCVGIYAVLVSTIQMSDDIHSALFGVMGYTVILAFSLMKTGSLSKSVFSAH
ncbi:MAG: hypothetical protein K6B14_03095 [Lachnospiraceae bacterium]|nr:hypothetical protein [Lachnospiraceae bacterium]